MEKEPIQHLIDRLTNNEEATFEEANNAEKDLNSRVSYLESDLRQKFEHGKLMEMIKNIRDIKDQKYARAKCKSASKEYDDLKKLASDYNYVRNQAGPSTYSQIHGRGRQKNRNNIPNKPMAQHGPGLPNMSTYTEHLRQQKPDRNAVESKRNNRDIEDISKQASHQMKKNNPNIADLSDANRPTKIAERYSELYDNEWTEAFDELTTRFGLTEFESINFLYELITRCYRYAVQTAAIQIETLYNRLIETLKGERTKNHEAKLTPTDEDIDILRQLRKGMGMEGIKALQEEFISEIFPKFVEEWHKLRGRRIDTVQIFSKKSVEIAWLMCIQDPPVEMCIDATTDTSKYRAYTKSGTEIDFIVWPCVILCKDGPILCKGVAQFK